MKVKVWKLLGLMLIAVFALSAANASAYPTLSSMAGTYAEQTSSGTGYNIILYDNGTALFSTYSGTWSIFNSTTIEGTYRIVSVHTDYFTITNNGFIATGTGNVYVKTASASPSPTASASASPTTSANPSPTIPEFGSATLILAAALAVVTLAAVVLTKRPRKQLRK
jgi:hypothetical protein